MDQLDGKFSKLPVTLELLMYKFVYKFNIWKKYNAHNALLGALTAIFTQLSTETKPENSLNFAWDAIKIVQTFQRAILGAKMAMHFSLGEEMSHSSFFLRVNLDNCKIR